MFAFSLWFEDLLCLSAYIFITVGVFSIAKLIEDCRKAEQERKRQPTSKEDLRRLTSAMYLDSKRRKELSELIAKDREKQLKDKENGGD